MNASLISLVTYELIRSESDRLQMSWEDDRSRLLCDYHKLVDKLDRMMTLVTENSENLLMASLRIQRYVHKKKREKRKRSSSLF